MADVVLEKLKKEGERLAKLCAPDASEATLAVNADLIYSFLKFARWEGIEDGRKLERADMAKKLIAKRASKKK